MMFPAALNENLTPTAISPLIILNVKSVNREIEKKVKEGTETIIKTKFES